MIDGEDRDREGGGRIVASDEFCRVVRVEERLDGTRAVRRFSFREALHDRFAFLQERLVHAGWPPLEGRVLVRGDGDRDWDFLDPDLEARLESEVGPPVYETMPPAPIHSEIGFNFILRRVEPPTTEYWYAQEVKTIWVALNVDTPDEAMKAARDLGELQEMAERHHRDLPAAQRRQERYVPFREAVETFNLERKEASEAWKAEAFRNLEDMWGRDSEKSASAVAKTILNEILNETGATPPPAERTLRKAIGHLLWRAPLRADRLRRRF